MKRKINAKNVSVLFLATAILSMAIGIIGSYSLHVLYPYANINVLFNTSVLFCFIHTPLALAAADSLRHELGWQSPVRIAKNSFVTQRKIPLGVNGKTSHIFMSSVPWVAEKPRTESFTVTIDGVDYTVLLSEMESFIRTAWARQRNGKSGLSRTYWIKRSQPRLKTLEYNARMQILKDIPGLIVDRGQGRSGRLAVSPLLIMDALA